MDVKELGVPLYVRVSYEQSIIDMKGEGAHPYGPKSEGAEGGGGRLMSVGAVMMELQANSMLVRHPWER